MEKEIDLEELGAVLELYQIEIQNLRAALELRIKAIVEGYNETKERYGDSEALRDKINEDLNEAVQYFSEEKEILRKKYISKVKTLVG